MAAGVIFALLAVGSATAIAVVLVLFFYRHRKQKSAKFYTSDRRLGAFTNQIYDTELRGHKGTASFTDSHNEYSCPDDYTTKSTDESYEDMSFKVRL